jgi:hypothetical protein
MVGANGDIDPGLPRAFRPSASTGKEINRYHLDKL